MKFEDRDFLPVILGGDITAYSLARSFYEAYQVKSLVISQVESNMISDSSMVDNRIVNGMENVEVFLPKLAEFAAEFPNKKLLLLACGDWYVRLIAEQRDQLPEAYVDPYVSLELLDRLVLKDSFYRICDEVGVPYPKTYVYDCANPPQRLELPFDYPVIAKPASSAEYHYAQFPGKKKVFKFSNQAELEEMLNNLATSDYRYKFLIQEFIPGDDTQMRILTCYSDQDAKVRFAAFGQTLLEDKAAMGVGNPVAIINRVDPTIVEYARKLLEHVGYTGFSNFDIKVDPRDGRPYFFEINTRLGRSNYYVTASGFNVVPWMVKDLIEGEEFPEKLVVADNTESLYTVVPQETLDEWVTEPELRAEVDRLFQEHKATNPVDFPAEDKFVRRTVYPRIFMAKQRKRFKEALNR